MVSTTHNQVLPKALAFAEDAPLKADFDDGKALEEALNRKAVGTYYTLEIIETESKGKTLPQLWS